MSNTVDWKPAEANRKIASELALALDALATAIEDQAQQNIEDNDQIDTGFLHSSSYVITPLVDTFPNVPVGGQYVSGKTGFSVYRFSTTKPPRTPGKKSAIVGFAAEYALYPELQNSYLYRAVIDIDADEVIRQSINGEI